MARRASQKHRERGATMLECALALPFLIVFTLGAVDMMRFVAIRSALLSAASDAVAFAQVEPGIDRDNHVSGNPQASIADIAAYDAAYIRVADYARARATSLFVGGVPYVGSAYLTRDPIITIPPSSSSKSRFDAMVDTATSVTLEATIVFTVPMIPSLTIQVSAFGFREPQEWFGFPVAFDGSTVIVLGGSRL